MAAMRYCARSGCGRPLPAEATGRRRYCTPACRQAEHRDRHGVPAASGRVDVGQLAGLDRLLAATAGELARLATLAEDAESAPDTTARCYYVSRLTDLTGDVVRAAVARDRAAGLSWDEIGEWLGLHRDTARARYRDTLAELTARPGAPRRPGR